MTERDDFEKLLAILGQTVSSVLADTRLEILALRQILAEHKTLSQRELDERIVSLRADKLPTLTASASADIQERFWRLREKAGLS